MPDNKKLKVLYLTRWYPNRFDPMPGLFIQRHAEAANLFCKVGVVYVHSIDYKFGIPDYEIDNNVVNGVPTIKIYYKNPKNNFAIITPIIKAFRFYKANFLGINEIKSNFGGFDILHIHILSRLGIFGLYYKWLFGKKYFISEHWSRYLELTGNFKGFFRKYLTKLVVKNAAVVTTVTENLALAMQKHSLKNRKYIVLPNVVSPAFLNPKKESVVKSEKKSIVHVSCFEDKSKNISGILNVIEKLMKTRSDFIFTMVGDGMDFEKLKMYSMKLGITDEQIEFTGLLEGDSLVSRMQSAEALLIFSNYENFPVVINEAFSLGVPVIATRVGGIPEYVEKANGIIVEPGDEKGLLMAINGILDGKYKFSTTQIKQTAINNFSMQSVGKQLYNIYLDN